MTKEEQNALQIFETRVRQLILQYKELEKEKSKLLLMIDEKAAKIEALTKENNVLRNDFAHLKLARMIEISNTDIKDAKSTLSRLIREIDKCIALLNV